MIYGKLILENQKRKMKKLIDILREMIDELDWENSFLPTDDKRWNEKDNSRSNNKNFNYMSKMNDTPQNRSNMELLNMGPNTNRTYKKYVFPWKKDIKD